MRSGIVGLLFLLFRSQGLLLPALSSSGDNMRRFKLPSVVAKNSGYQNELFSQCERTHEQETDGGAETLEQECFTDSGGFSIRMPPGFRSGHSDRSSDSNTPESAFDFGSSGASTATSVPCCPNPFHKAHKVPDSASFGGLSHVALMKAKKNAGMYNKQGGWEPSYQFPGQFSQMGVRPNIMEKNSIKAVSDFCCYSHSGCKGGTCLSKLDDLDVQSFRRKLVSSGYEGYGECTTDYLANQLLRCYDAGTIELSGTIRVNIDTLCVDLCPVSFAFLGGFTYCTYNRAKYQVRNGKTKQPQIRFSSRERESLGVSMARAYIQSVIVEGAQHNPAPGAQRTSEAVVNKEPMKRRYDAMVAWFGKQEENGTSLPVLPARNKFKMLWRMEKTLHEKTVSTHGKCDMCAQFTDERTKRLGNKSTEVLDYLKELDNLEALHILFCEKQRRQLDLAGLTAIKYPTSMWCIIADAATQRNFGKSTHP